LSNIGSGITNLGEGVDKGLTNLGQNLGKGLEKGLQHLGDGLAAVTLLKVGWGKPEDRKSSPQHQSPQ